MLMLAATFIAEVVFYGCFLWGAWLVVRGFTEAGLAEAWPAAMGTPHLDS